MDDSRRLWIRHELPHHVRNLKCAPQRYVRNMRINLGSCDAGMPKQALNKPSIHPTF